MKRPVVGYDAVRDHGLRLCKSVDSFGYTLVEILVATVLSLILMGAVVRMFGDVGESITDSRSMLESADRLRVAEARLQLDLAGITATPNPPRDPANNEGYFEYIEGPVTQATAPTYARNSENSNSMDTTVGDFDDILMFTTRSKSRPFVGKSGASGTIQSDVAEVAWFLRGNTLHRRVLLIAPGATLTTPSGYSFYAANDISVRLDSSLVANTLGDLTKRENRYAHQTGSFPFCPYLVSTSPWLVMRLPTLCECSSPSWSAGATLPSPTLTFDKKGTELTSGTFDAWQCSLPYTQLDAATGAHSSYYIPNALAKGQRIADDVILTNVIGFDVKAYDPDVGGYVDLGYTTGMGRFSSSQTCIVGLANPKFSLPRVYDTWSTHYDSVGASGLSGTPGLASNGFDDVGNSGSTNGIVDDDDEKLTSPPYPYPLRGIQVKIRTFEPDSKQVREVTVVQDFLPQ